MLDGRTRAAANDRSFQVDAVDAHVAADGDVVDRHAGVLAREVVGAFGHRNVPDHRAEDRLCPRIGLRARKTIEPLLDILGQDLQRADVEILGRFLDELEIDVHPGAAFPDAQLTVSLRCAMIFPHLASSSLIALPNASGALPTAVIPCAASVACVSGSLSTLTVSR